MGNKKVNYPDILQQEQPPKHLSLSCNSRVKIDLKVYINNTKNDINWASSRENLSSGFATR